MVIKMGVIERLTRYCQIDTQSDPHSGTTPSTEKQFHLAKLLVEELKELGLEEITLDEHCYVYAKLPANIENECAKVGFIAHLDTAPDFTAEHVNPRVIECFDGNDIVLNPDVIMRMDDFPWMRKFKGKTLMVTDGNSLLGSDDKAGITSIMEALTYLREHPEIKHGTICVAFTPDEEIGEGTKYFDLEKMGADFAYTMDGGPICEVADENFNASGATVTFKGISIHPGAAKDRMINASRCAAFFQSLLPEEKTPENTAGFEGFIHLHGMKGDVESAELEYILRDHDKQKLQEQKDLLTKAVELVNLRFGKQVAEITFSDTYENMKEVLQNYPQVSKYAREALLDLGIQPVTEPIRGGTDGAHLSFMGLPCPNLGNGGGNFHGRFEYNVIDELEQAVQLIVRIAEKVAEV